MPFDQHKMPFGPFDQHKMPYSSFGQHKMPFGSFDQHKMPFGSFDQHKMPFGSFDQHKMPFGPFDQHKMPLGLFSQDKMPFRPFKQHKMPFSNFSGPWRTSCLLPCSHSMVSLSKIPCTNNFTQVNSSPDMLLKGGGDVVYRTVPWNRRLLAQHHKKPAGPLFDIKCQQQSDEDSPPDPVQALVLLFYKPLVDPDLRSFLSVLLLPRNIVIRDLQKTRRKLNGDERYIDTSPHCKLHPKQVYTLPTVPEDDLITVQPKEIDFDDKYHDSYFTTFQVILRRILTDVNLSLKDESSSTCVWERDVCLFCPTVGTLNRPPSQRLANTRSCFIEGISGPVLSSLIDKLLEKTVITDAEREEADTMKNKREKARFVIDTVRSKGQAASPELINFLHENDIITSSVSTSG
ncbi:unnamed protein product [Oreochromis niloticus]|nr:unnamed protein product [Mustela putorius furo]